MHGRSRASHRICADGGTGRKARCDSPSPRASACRTKACCHGRARSRASRHAGSGARSSRAKARNEVEKQGQARLASIRKQGEDDLHKIRAEGITTIKRIREDATATLGRLQSMLTIVLPLMIMVACVIVGLLALINVRERRTEIGILRALGTRSQQIFTLFVTRSALVGLVGAAVGYGIGILAALLWSSGAATGGAGTWLMPELLIGLLVAAPLLAVLAGWLPAMLAANEDPAIVLRDN